RAAVGVLAGGTGGTFGAAAIGVLVLTAAVKYGLYRYVLGVGEERRSPALVATALDNRNDILTAGAALVGV
ncbi:MAG: cation transporter, partial [Actinobacteria bacterium]|nr:cation transporter [Actinomycetota bacterium]NIU66028.1 cation transporter [Actinomycetota bacterium]NIW27836.1 cation transporter [Actinomycetota bacterium]NIX20337.1 cation transporter [Actinomycetota bacterium]